MEKKSKKSIIIGITSLFLVMLLLVGLTYAYYRTRITGNDSTDPSISVVSKKLEVKYTDGNSTVNMEGKIEPGFEYTKTFTVENTGDDTVGYVLYLEDVVNEYTRTEDWTYEITCSPNCNGTDGYVEYPTLSEKLLENEIASKTTQTYNVTIKYADSEDDQSDDMGATIEGKFNIYSPEYVVDIEGEIAGASEGDYVQINSVKKVSKIVNGKYRLPAVEVGSHTLRVMSKTGTEKGSTTLTINKGTQGISGTTITMDDKSETVTLNITSIASNLGIEIKSIKEAFTNPYTEGTLAYAILNDNEVTDPLTVPGQAVSLETEAVLASTKDDYGTSYYFRGNIINNYVNYSGLCWRIVRIQGDGTIKLVLADKHGECNADTYSTSSSRSGIVSSSSYSTNESVYFYEKSLIVEILNNWMVEEEWDDNGDVIREPLDTSKLSDTYWCNDISGEASNRLTMATATPTLKCDMIGENGSAIRYLSNIGILTADEVAFAGGAQNSNGTYYLYTNANESSWWLMTLSRSSIMYTVHSLGGFHPEYVNNDWKVRPAVVLKNDVLATTDAESTYAVGTYKNPYVIG